jgi:hypothetical protein
MNKERIELFGRAFISDGGRCRGTCHCGKTYYRADDPIIDWEKGELEELEASENAIGVDFGVGLFVLEGCEYVDACDCWHKKAEQLMALIDNYACGIATYLTLEKKRKQEEADKSPVVE